MFPENIIDRKNIFQIMIGNLAINDSLGVSDISGYELALKLLLQAFIAFGRGFWIGSVIISFIVYPPKKRRKLGIVPNIVLFTYQPFWIARKFKIAVLMNLLRIEEEKRATSRRILTEKNQGIGAVIPLNCQNCNITPSVRVAIEGLSERNNAIVECEKCGAGYSVPLDFVNDISGMRHIYLSISSDSLRNVLGYKDVTFSNELLALTTKIAIEGWDSGVRNIKPYKERGTDDKERYLLTNIYTMKQEKTS